MASEWLADVECATGLSDSAWRQPGRSPYDVRFMTHHPAAYVVLRDLRCMGFGVLKALISDQGSHFCNCAMAMLLEKYGVVH
ncbi:hypothetical protein CR513_37064, partial [Mucuna pruriens]